jgi:hypothetical protein
VDGSLELKTEVGCEHVSVIVVIHDVSVSHDIKEIQCFSYLVSKHGKQQYHAVLGRSLEPPF